MNKGNIILLLNEKLPIEERFFKMSSCTLKGEDGAEHVHIVLLVPADKYDIYLDEKNEEACLRSTIYFELAKLLPEGMTLHLSFKKTVSTETQVAASVLEFIKSDNRLLVPKIKAQDIDIKIVPQEYMEITISVSKPVYEFCEKNAFKERLKAYLDVNFLEDAEIILKDVYEEEDIELHTLQAPPARLVSYELTEPIYGTLRSRAKYITDVLELGVEIELVTITGIVSGFREFPRKNVENLFYYLFRIDDKTANIDVKCFPRTLANCNAMRILKDGDTVVIDGSLRRDDRSNKLVIWVKSISKARIDYEKALKDMKYLNCPQNYFLVKPEPYIEEKVAVNMNIFDVETEDDIVVPESLVGKTFVIFDTETTGLNPESDVIIELSAVKMVDGVLKETWQTFVNPFTHNRPSLPKDIVKLTGITDEMLQPAPTFNKIVGDFYKFCFGATLVAHNAPFDIGMLLPPARKLGYNFDNPVVDTLVMAKNIFPKLPSHRLGYLCEQLDVRFDGDAHRAIFDAIATARLFRKLSIKK